MTMQQYSIEELLALDKFNVDDQQAHIVVDKTRCRECKTRPCLVVCSAVCYKMDGGHQLQFDYAGCLECGACRVVCYALGNAGITTWIYPRSTFGVKFRYG